MTLFGPNQGRPPRSGSTNGEKNEKPAVAPSRLRFGKGRFAGTARAEPILPTSSLAGTTGAPIRVHAFLILPDRRPQLGWTYPPPSSPRPSIRPDQKSGRFFCGVGQVSVCRRVPGFRAAIFDLRRCLLGCVALSRRPFQLRLANYSVQIPSSSGCGENGRNDDPPEQLWDTSLPGFRNVRDKSWRVEEKTLSVMASVS